MPEGHTIHRLARAQQRELGGRVVLASSPQGRFVDGAALINGRALRRTDAWGKHLFHRYDGGLMLHIHLGLFGKFTAGEGEAPVPRGALRLRLTAENAWLDLRGPTACELLDRAQFEELRARLGPDPLRARADPAPAWRRIAKSSAGIGTLLMDQTVIAGIGNVYRAELLFRHRVDPYLPGRQLPEPVWDGMWSDLVRLMRAGVRSGRIVTVEPERMLRARARLNREESVYVYRRTGLPCRICSTPIRTAVLAARNLFWCPQCQAGGNAGAPDV